MPNQNYDYLIATAGRLVRKYPFIVAWNRLKRFTPAQTQIALMLAEQRRAPKNALFYDKQESRWYTIDDLPILTQSEVEKLLPQTKETKP